MTEGLGTPREQAETILKELNDGISRGYAPGYYESRMAKVLRAFLAVDEWEWAVQMYGTLSWNGMPAEYSTTEVSFGVGPQAEEFVREYVAKDDFGIWEGAYVVRRRAATEWERADA